MKIMLPSFYLFLMTFLLLAPTQKISATIQVMQYQHFEKVGNAYWEKWDFPSDLLAAPRPQPIYRQALGLLDSNIKSQSTQAIYYYDCTVPFSDSDERAMACADYQGETVELFWPTGSMNVHHTFEEISQFLTPELERLHDLIFLVNTEPMSSKGGLIPGQHLLVIQRQYPQISENDLEQISYNRVQSSLLFTRNNSGIINGLTNNAKPLSQIIPNLHLQGPGKWRKLNQLELIPISSGTPGKNGIETFSGIFQLNWAKSIRNLFTSFKAPMSYAIYIGYLYNSGRDSGVAIHGTPPTNWSRLGQKASHGCVRLHPHYAQQFYQLISNTELSPRPLLDWNYNLPVMQMKNGPIRPVLIVLFKGYQRQEV